LPITFSNLNRFVAKSLVAYFFGTQCISNGFFDVECDAMVDMTVNDSRIRYERAGSTKESTYPNHITRIVN